MLCPNSTWRRVQAIRHGIDDRLLVLIEADHPTLCAIEMARHLRTWRNAYGGELEILALVRKTRIESVTRGDHRRAAVARRLHALGVPVAIGIDAGNPLGAGRAVMAARRRHRALELARQRWGRPSRACRRHPRAWRRRRKRHDHRLPDGRRGAPPYDASQRNGRLYRAWRCIRMRARSADSADFVRSTRRGASAFAVEARRRRSATARFASRAAATPRRGSSAHRATRAISLSRMLNFAFRITKHMQCPFGGNRSSSLYIFIRVITRMLGDCALRAIISRYRFQTRE